MRLWLVNLKVMCNQHLLGEHVECHMFVGSINKGKNLDGYIKGGLLQFDKLVDRHKQLAEEMERRKMNHNSPLPVITKILKQNGKVDSEGNYKELCRRCEACAKLYKKHFEPRQS